MLSPGKQNLDKRSLTIDEYLIKHLFYKSKEPKKKSEGTKSLNHYECCLQENKILTKYH
jgi:hypothetical protein